MLKWNSGEECGKTLGKSWMMNKAKWETTRLRSNGWVFLDNSCSAFSWQKLREFSSTLLPCIHGLYSLIHNISYKMCTKTQSTIHGKKQQSLQNANYISNDYGRTANKFSRPLPFPIFAKHFVKCLTTLPLCLKLWSHKMQPNRLISECTAWCCFNVKALQKLFGHWAQTYGFTSSCPSKCLL